MGDFSEEKPRKTKKNQKKSLDRGLGEVKSEQYLARLAIATAQRAEAQRHKVNGGLSFFTRSVKLTRYDLPPKK